MRSTGLHTTGESHKRVMVLEVMGRHAGWIACGAASPGAAHVILLPEIPFSLEQCGIDFIKHRDAQGHHSTLVVVAEGATCPTASSSPSDANEGGEVRLGGIGERVACQLGKLTGKETRSAPSATSSAAAPPLRSIDPRHALRRHGRQTRRTRRLRPDGQLSGLPVISVPIEEAVHHLRSRRQPDDEFVHGRQSGGHLSGRLKQLRVWS